MPLAPTHTRWTAYSVSSSFARNPELLDKAKSLNLIPRSSWWAHPRLKGMPSSKMRGLCGANGRVVWLAKRVGPALTRDKRETMGDARRAHLVAIKVNMVGITSTVMTLVLFTMKQTDCDLLCKNINV